jgi:hypothetical protein
MQMCECANEEKPQKIFVSIFFHKFIATDNLNQNYTNFIDEQRYGVQVSDLPEADKLQR